MKLSIQQIAMVFAGVVAYFALLYYVHRALRGRMQAIFRYVAVAVTAGLFFWTMQEKVPRHDLAVNYTKLAVAVTAAAAVFYEQYRKGIQRPIAERWKKFVAICLALAAIGCYFNGFRFGYPRYWHRWDQYHYFMGAKYFPELRYTDLYKCAVVAEDELETVRYNLDKPFGASRPRMGSVNLRAEMRDPDKKVRDLGGDNLLVPVGPILDHPEQCKERFTTERWDEYKSDVLFFRIVSGKGYWTDMQKDHGFNPPPVWTLGGKFFSDLHAGSVLYNQFLASLDLIYLIGMFVALYWGFGWRVFAVGAIFWGCQSSAPFYWTGGAFLRQDWLFFSVLSVACMRRRYFKVAGASLVYAGLLRIFPGLVVIGTLVPFIAHIIKKRRIHRDHMQMLIGGCLAAAVLLPLSVAMTDKHAYQDFYSHTLQTHDKTPLTNHMGLRVIIAHRFFDFQKPGMLSAEEAGSSSVLKRIQWPIKLAKGKASGQMEYTRDNSLHDPFEVWKTMRNERYAKYKWLAYAIVLATLIWFAVVVQRMKSLWVAQCLGQIFVILLSQLTCYYYVFMILGAPLIKLRKQIELGMFALAAITQIIWVNSYWNDNKYTLLTIASLVFCFVMIGMFWRIRPPAHEEEYEEYEEYEDEDEDAAAAAA